jgi:hypothetical protein
LIKEGPCFVKEHDLQNIILPLISIDKPKEIVLYSLKVFNSCDASSFDPFYLQLLRQIYLIFSDESFLSLYIIEVSFSLVASVSLQFNLQLFLEKTSFLLFLQNSTKKIQNNNPILQKLLNNISILEEASKY